MLCGRCMLGVAIYLMMTLPSNKNAFYFEWGMQLPSANFGKVVTAKPSCFELNSIKNY